MGSSLPAVASKVIFGGSCATTCWRGRSPCELPAVETATRPGEAAGTRWGPGHGLIEVDSVELIPFADITDADVRRAGEPDRESLRRRAARAARSTTARWCTGWSSTPPPAAWQVLDPGVSWYAGICIYVNRQDQQAIDDLFSTLTESAAPRRDHDPGPRPGSSGASSGTRPAWCTTIGAERSVGRAAGSPWRAQLADCQQQLQQGGRWAGFGRRGRREGRPQAYGGYKASGAAPQAGSHPQAAVSWPGQPDRPGVSAAASWLPRRWATLFSGDGLFGGDRDYDDDQAFDQGYEDKPPGPGTVRR